MISEEQFNEFSKFNTQEQCVEFFKHINRKSIRMAQYDRLFSENKFAQSLFKDGFTKEDVKVFLFRGEPIVHHFCPNCGKEVHAKNQRYFRDGKFTYFPLCCSPECVKIIKPKNIESGIMKKFGVRSPLLIKEIKEKRDETVLRKYGCKNVFSNKEIQNKIKNTNLKKYGNEVSVISEHVKIKRRETMKKKHGIDSISPFVSKDFQDSLKENLILKYGVGNPTQIPEIAEKVSLTKLSNSFDKVCEILKRERHLSPNFNKSEWRGYFKSHEWKCDICGNVFSACMNSNESGFPICRHCHPKTISMGEESLKSFIDELFGVNSKKIKIDNKEIDIFIEELSLGFEFNGDYWHSDKNLEFNYHQSKSIFFSEMGIRVFYIWENDWGTRRSFVKEFISDIKNFSKIIDFSENEFILDLNKPSTTLKTLVENGFEIVKVFEPELRKSGNFSYHDSGKILLRRNQY
jgi:uncharacterized protein YlaI